MITYGFSFTKGLKFAESVEHTTFDSQTAVNVKLKHVFARERLWLLEVKQKTSVNWLQLTLLSFVQVVEGFVVRYSGLEVSLSFHVCELKSMFSVGARDSDD